MNWDRIEKILQEGVTTGVFPGAVAAIGMKGKPTKIFAVGRTRSDSSARPVTKATGFDLASLTKVILTTTVIARLVDRKEVDVKDEVVTSLRDLPWNEAWHGVTLEDVMYHRAGFAAWVDYRTQLSEEEQGNPKLARVKIPELIAASAPEYKPCTKTVYSDLGFILLGEWLKQVKNSDLERIFEREVRKPMNIFSPAGDIAATENKPCRGGMVQGIVDDDNAYLMGELCGHAGLFGTAEDCLVVGQEWLKATRGESDFLSKGTADYFTKRGSKGGAEPRALGWDVPSKENSSAGKKVSQHAVGHLGFTGTSIWIDFSREVVIVLLTNRVHPTSRNEKIRTFRPRFHDTVWEVVDQ